MTYGGTYDWPGDEDDDTMPVDDEETIRRLKAELRVARARHRESRRAATLRWFRSLPFGGTDVTGR